MRLQKKPKFFYLKIIAALSCVALHGCFFNDDLKNRRDAQTISEDPLQDVGDLSQESGNPISVPIVDINRCPTANEFRVRVQPIQQSKCIVCHKVGGRGGSKYILATGSSDADLSKNFSIAKSKILAEDDGRFEKNPLLAYPLGGFGHDKIFSNTDSDFDIIADWIALDRANPCD